VEQEKMYMLQGNKQIDKYEWTDLKRLETAVIKNEDIEEFKDKHRYFRTVFIDNTVYDLGNNTIKKLLNDVEIEKV
jgi:hypothetical protein